MSGCWAGDFCLEGGLTVGWVEVTAVVLELVVFKDAFVQVEKTHGG